MKGNSWDLNLFHSAYFVYDIYKYSPNIYNIISIMDFTKNYRRTQ